MLHKAIVFIFALKLAKVFSADCTISINKDLGDPQPLVLKQDPIVGNTDFYLPDNGDTISLKNGDVVKVACPGGHLIIGDVALSDVSISNATCNGGKFDINDKSVSFVDVTCSSYPVHEARKTGGTCLENHTEIEIGFELNEVEFLRLITICFDETADNTLYSAFNLTKTIGGYQVSYPRPGWLQGKFYSVTGVNTLYTRATQRTTINSLLNVTKDTYKYVAKSGDLYLTRGHLTAKTDFLYGAQHRATFYFINAVPQWQTFNAVNWGKLEQNVRDFASENQKDLIVYTGTHGVTTLKHETTGEDVELYLSANGDVRKIPVPKLIWKVAYEPSTKSGIALIGVNNPYRTQDDLAKEIICQDVSDQVSWVTWNRTNLKNGYGYSCAVEDFRKVVHNLPEFEVTKLLI